MLFSVIVPTCNRNDLLSKCLDRLVQTVQTIKDDYEIIVTDDSKSSEAKALIEEKYPSVKWITGPRKGPASNRNNGASHAKAPWLVFIDDDCVPEKEILAEYRNAIALHPESRAFEGTIIPDDWDKLKEDMSECPINTTGGYFWSANICVNANLYREIGGFDQNFLIAAQEDQDIYVRLSKLTKIVFIKESIVVHPVRKIALGKKINQIPIATKNWFIYETKHNTQSGRRTFRMAVSFVVQFSKGVVKSLLKGKLKTAVYQFFQLFVGIPVYLNLSIKNNWNG